MLKNTNTTTEENEMQNLTIAGREFTAQGPTSTKYPAYVLTGPKGAAYLAVQAFRGDETIYKVLGTRALREVWIGGNQAFFQVQDDGSLSEWNINR